MSDGVLVGRMYRPQDTRPKGAVAKLGEEVIWGVFFPVLKRSQKRRTSLELTNPKRRSEESEKPDAEVVPL